MTPPPSTSRAVEVLSPQLRELLERCAAARSLVEPEQAKIRLLIEQAGSDIEREAREYQHDLVAWQLNRAAELSEKRLAHFDALADTAAESERCAADASHWFEMYAWGQDPRPDAPLSVMPFALFEFQERFVAWLDYLTFEKRTSGVVEKSRDMGATETALRWMLHKWLYRSGFVGLILSANEDLVDSKKDPGTLFEKLRFQLRLLPGWMLPEGFNLDRDMPYMQVSNQPMGSILQGDAPTANVGRQRRATFILKDESAAWANGGYAQHTALSRTSNTICDVSSVQGKFNKFHDLAHDGRTARFEMDWREHPWRDERWYRALPYGHVGVAMTEEEIAQEVDRNYEASQPGRVLKNVKEEYCFITWSELARGFDEYGLAHHFRTPGGRYVIPEPWKWGRVSDWGESAKEVDDTHVWAYSLFARPSEGFPFADTLFFFLSLPVEPIGCAEEEGFGFYSELERALGVRGDTGFTRAPDVSDFSHEAVDAKQVLSEKFGEEWDIPDLDFDKGRRKLIFHFNLTDTREPNPWRPELTGRSRIVFVAPDGEYQLARHDRDKRYFVTPSKTQFGFKRLRKEIAAWHYPPEEQGKAVPKMRPVPKFDDVITTVRYACARWGVDSARLSDFERRVAKIPKRLRPAEVMAAKGTGAFPELVAAASHAMKQVEVQERREKEKYSQGWAKAAGRPVVHRRYKKGGLK